MGRRHAGSAGSQVEVTASTEARERAGRKSWAQQAQMEESPLDLLPARASTCWVGTTALGSHALPSSFHPLPHHWSQICFVPRLSHSRVFGPPAQLTLLLPGLPK